VANFLTRPVRLPWDGALTTAWKAATLALPQPRRRGGYVGDPITNG
jgi:hypothetical protein